MPIPQNAIEALYGYFDKIFVVTIPRFAGRHAKVKERLQGLNADLFWGADKLDLDIDALKRDGVYDEVTTKQLQRQGKGLNLGEVACSLSHRMVYEQMIQHNWKRVLVLEDDVVPLKENLQYLPAALKELPEDWELVYLGYLKHENVTFGLKVKQFFYRIISGLGLMKWTPTMIGNLLPKKISRHIKKAGFHDCTHAYGVTLEGAKKFVASQTPVIYRADDLLSYNVLKGNIKGYVTEPKFFDQEIFHDQSLVSDIR